MAGWTWTTLAILLLVAGALEALIENVRARHRRRRQEQDRLAEGRTPWWS
tara:strand:- start:835 stop:984 length:150 start_codon:yes stop_codon:yes gene_type:complete